MKFRYLTIVFCLILFAFSGCQEHSRLAIPDKAQAQPDQVLPAHYQVAIVRTTTVEIKKDTGESAPQKMTENLIADLSLWSVKNRKDRIIFRAVCNSVNILRSDFSGKTLDAEPLNYLLQKEFELTISKEGSLLDDSSIKELMRRAVKDPSQKSCQGNFKYSDMLIDFYNVIVDLCGTAAKDSYSQGEEFIRHEPTPTPAVEFPLPQRKIISMVDQLVDQEGTRKAKIIELHIIADNTQATLTDIYPELIKTKGLFSNLRRWRTKSIGGTGEKVVNLNTGLLESSSQDWQIKAEAGFVIPIRDSHLAITIEQVVEIQQIQ